MSTVLSKIFKCFIKIQSYCNQPVMARIDFKISYLYFYYQRYKINPGPNW